MKRSILYILPCLLVFGVRAMHAQTGCVHSPECPTAVLGAVGAAGAALYAKLRSR